MTTLNLSQVEKANRLAVRFFSHRGDVLVWCPRAKTAVRVTSGASVSWDDATTHHGYGWHHMPGCDCEFCREPEC